MRSKKYYKRMFQTRPVTQYDFADEKQEWLGSVNRDGSLKENIPINNAKALHGMSRIEYLLDFHRHGMLCGIAELLVEQHEQGNK